MGDALVLVALFAFLYLTDSFYLLHKHSAAFRVGSGGRCRIVLPSANAGNRDRALHAYSLLPPLRPTFVSNLLPVSLSGEGILSYVSQTIAAAGRPGQSCRALSFGEIRSAGAEGDALIVNGERFATCRGPEHAALLARAVDEIVKDAGGNPPSTIRSAIRSTLDVGQVRRVVEEFRTKSVLLRILCNALFFLLFLLFPLLCGLLGARISVFVALAALGVLLPLVCVSFHSLHKRYSSEGPWERAGCLLRFVLCPPCAIRACDQLSRNLVGKYHPIAVALALAPEPDAADFVRTILRDLRHPLRQDVGDPLSLSIDAEWRKEMTSEIERAALRSGMESRNMLMGIDPADGPIAAYCPRCLATFSSAVDSCPDCAGVPAVSCAPSP